MNCPKCNKNEFIKSGMAFGRQRYLCKPCNYYYTVELKDNTAIKKQALDLYLEGLGFRSIGRIIKVSHVTVYNWIKDFGRKLNLDTCGEKAIVTELDEMHTYIKSKKTSVGSG